MGRCCFDVLFHAFIVCEQHSEFFAESCEIFLEKRHDGHPREAQQRHRQASSERSFTLHSRPHVTLAAAAAAGCCHYDSRRPASTAHKIFCHGQCCAQRHRKRGQELELMKTASSWDLLMFLVTSIRQHITDMYCNEYYFHELFTTHLVQLVQPPDR